MPVQTRNMKRVMLGDVLTQDVLIVVLQQLNIKDILRLRKTSTMLRDSPIVHWRLICESRRMKKEWLDMSDEHIKIDSIMKSMRANDDILDAKVRWVHFKVMNDELDMVEDEDHRLYIASCELFMNIRAIVGMFTNWEKDEGEEEEA
ncbi:hypothetical protein OAO87_00140 [bacterium]|nr:hypothetical protein [bacterium]